jgi:hypothetical protein
MDIFKAHFYLPAARLAGATKAEAAAKKSDRIRRTRTIVASLFAKYSVVTDLDDNGNELCNPHVRGDTSFKPVGNLQECT